MRTLRIWVMAAWVLMLSGGALQADEEIFLVVRADDMGAAHAMNAASIQTCVEGIARTVEVMVPGPWYAEAVQMLRGHPDIDVGIHLTLTSEWENVKWGPLTQAKTLVDAMGWFYPTTWQRNDSPPDTAFVHKDLNLEEVENELRAQIERGMKDIPRISHVSFHMGAAGITPLLKRVTERVLEDYALPYQLPDAKHGVVYGGTDASAEEKETALLRSLESLTPGVYLCVIHAGLDTPEMRAIGHKGYEQVAADRAGVTFAFTSPKVKEMIQRKNIRLASYKDVLNR